MQFLNFWALASVIGARAKHQSHGSRHAADTFGASPSTSRDIRNGNYMPYNFYGESALRERSPSVNSGVYYKGNVGNPYGSNIIEVTATNAKYYPYVVEFEGPKSDIWTVAIWNKIGPDGLLDGWYSRACKMFSLAPGETRYIAFEENSQGGWAAAAGTSIPTDSYGGYASTWGEFDFGSSVNSGWSGFDVSAIAAQKAGLEVQGMQICDSLIETCSSISAHASIVTNAYVHENRQIGGIGGKHPSRSG